MINVVLLAYRHSIGSHLTNWFNIETVP